MSILNKDEITKRLENISGWHFGENQIEKNYTFNDFAEAVSFVNKIAFDAEKMDHHPDILIYSWNKVKVSISTHSEGGVTEKDFVLAEKIEKRL